MYKRWQTDANYDPTDLYRVSIERLMASPSFADLRDELEQMKADLQSKEERQAMDREAGASVQMDIYEAMQEMIDDPDAANARDDLIELQARLGELDTNPDSPELEELMIRLDQKLDANPEFQRKLVARLQEGGLDPALADKPLEELLPSGAEKWDMNKPRDVDALMDSMQKLLTGMGGDPAVDKELEHARDKPEHPDELEPDEEDEELLEREFQAFSDDLSKLKDAPAPEDLEADKISPDLEAQVDKILDDPHLMEKLAFIKKMMDEAKSSESIFQNTSAPDPEKLDSADTTTLGKRLKTTEDDPEHIVGLRRLHIDLPSPFNVSPALKSLNEALKLAYVGANDDVRRILWRAYSKARNVPTLLQNMPDDAWDMVWYSQAVTWGSNQNRDDHLRVLMEDLQSVGRDGPPTHPEMLEDVE
ncbi:hypothetical protein EJ04DRAFT_507870 [Polyplosphaeria fusca]|uniref:Uncharacterized protein n=1 Tax=Polyplosphaeria fusca TaxID=682080 RepID=A0A9P4V9A0_9PLEO|nr:hypothetical protein EJ04DRAFT_507870 [Polyplosphaeria fusca]